MGIYDSHQPYPKWYDEMEECQNEECEYGHGSCFDAGYCIKEAEKWKK